MDMFERIRKNMGPLGQYANDAEGYYMFPKLEGKLGPRMKFRGKEVICWSINNYLGLGHHPEVLKADADATAKYGLAYPMGARMMSGNSDEHEALERELASFVHKPAVVLLNYGYQGFMSAIDAILSRRDVVVYDSESHACIVDGVRLHLGKRFTYDHNDMESLEKNLQRATRVAEESGGGLLVITEGVFGMKGDQGKLKEIAELKKKYAFRLLVDDAHGFGTLGATGAGTGEEQGVQQSIDLYLSTFAKSMASIGAFIAGDTDIIQYLKYNMRSQIFAKTLPMPLVIGARKRLELIRNHPEYLHKLWSNVKKLQVGLKERGLNIGDTSSCVTPVYLQGDPEEAANLVHDLREKFNIFCSVVVYPVVPRGTIILRLIPTALHSDADIQETLDAFGAISRKLKEGGYRADSIVNPLIHV
jgi:glycine C-acetyltransferase